MISAYCGITQHRPAERIFAAGSLSVLAFQTRCYVGLGSSVVDHSATSARSRNVTII